MSKNWFALIGLSLLAFTTFLDFTIVNAALPAIQQEFNAHVVTLQWIVNAYAIVISVLMILVGKFGDLFGRRRVFYIGALIFVIAALGAGFSNSIGMLISFRAVQGIAGACMFILGVALVPNLFPGDNQQHAIGVYSAITGIGLGIGPFLAGILVSTLGWRWVFFINIPIIVIGFLACAFVLPESDKQKDVKIDWLGFVALALFTVPLLLGLDKISSGGSTAGQTLPYFIVSLIALISLFIVEIKQQHPLLDLKIFANPHMLLSVLICSMAGLVSYELFFFDPLYLSSVRNLSAFWIGLALLCVPGSQVIISTFWGKLSNKHSIPKIIILAIVAGLISAILHNCFDLTTPWWIIIVAFLLLGVVWGIGNAGGVGYAISHSKPEKIGGNIGTIATIWNITGSFSVAIGAMIYHMREHSYLNQLTTSSTKTFLDKHGMALSANLSNVEKFKAQLKSLGLAPFEKWWVIFKQAFLSGFHAAMFFAVIVLAIGLAATIMTAKRIKQRALIND